MERSSRHPPPRRSQQAREPPGPPAGRGWSPRHRARSPDSPARPCREAGTRRQRGPGGAGRRGELSCCPGKGGLSLPRRVSACRSAEKTRRGGRGFCLFERPVGWRQRGGVSPPAVHLPQGNFRGHLMPPGLPCVGLVCAECCGAHPLGPSGSDSGPPPRPGPLCGAHCSTRPQDRRREPADVGTKVRHRPPTVHYFIGNGPCV